MNALVLGNIDIKFHRLCLSVHEKIKKIIGLTNLDALYLTEKEIENIFEFTMLIGFFHERFGSGKY